MKDMIEYYYNLDNIVLFNKMILDGPLNNYQYLIENNNSKYVLKKINYKMDSLNYDIINKLKREKYFLKPVMNINNEIVTKINNQDYIMLNCNIVNEKISLFDIRRDCYIDGYNFDINLWIGMWENKIDNFEIWLYDKKTQYSEYIPLFQYFIGVSENALLFLKKLKNINSNDYFSKCVASHRRVTIETTLYEYYDLTTIIPDHPCRDIAEYIKSTIINRVFDVASFYNYLEKASLSKMDINILYARILFPTFFYDIIEKENSKLDELINLIDYYEMCIEKISKLFDEKWHIRIIE